MKTLKEQFIEYVVGEALQKHESQNDTKRPLRILDVGCGTAAYVPGLMTLFPGIEYVGIEPIASSFAAAEQHTAIHTRATVHFGLAYDALEQYEPASFDLIISLSVLEHVKRLPDFIAFCDKYLIAGGMMVHRYDLGHALHTHSWKEWLHVRLGNHVPWLLPETQFVRYVSEAEVRESYAQNNIKVTKATYHQTPAHKSLEKLLSDTDSDIITDLFTWELAYQSDIARIPTNKREVLFPAVAVWGEKQTN